MGLWKSTRAVHACHLARSMLRLCETRFDLTCEHFFCPGHKGEPGNELVDTLALCAALGSPLQDWQHFISFTQKSQFVKAIEWAWMLHTQWKDAELASTVWTCPARPSTQPDLHVLPSSESIDRRPSFLQFTFQLRVATCNILTLKSRSAKQHCTITGTDGPARLEWILRSYDDLGIHIFALQETRMRTVKQTADERYHLIKSPAK